MTSEIHQAGLSLPVVRCGAGLGWSKQAPLSGMALKGPGLYLMLCCYHLEILDNIFKKACIFHFALGLDLAGVEGASVKVVDFIFVELGS